VLRPDLLLHLFEELGRAPKIRGLQSFDRDADIHQAVPRALHEHAQRTDDSQPSSAGEAHSELFIHEHQICMRFQGQLNCLAFAGVQLGQRLSRV
jgi:hypothetical protein